MSNSSATNPVQILGILNITSDSFYDGGSYWSNGKIDSKHIIRSVNDMLNSGADFIDIGGMSSRPGASVESADVEASRLLPAVELVLKEFPDANISVDTWRASIAEEAVQIGAKLINDISAGTEDPLMLETVARLKVPYILMHKLGSSDIMQENPQYGNVTDEVYSYLKNRAKAAQDAGIKEVIIDPGFGFGKTLAHNYQILKELEKLQSLNLPILVGISRKSMICNPLEISPKEALNGTSVLHTLALQKGIQYLRVHDVKEAKEAIKLVEHYNGAVI